MPESQVPMQVPEQQEELGDVSSHTATTVVASGDKTPSNNVKLSQKVVLSKQGTVQTENYARPSGNYHLKTDQTPSVDQHH